MMKACNVCNIEKPWTAEFFHANKRAACGLDYRCKDCRNSHRKEWSSRHPDAAKKQGAKRYAEKKEEYLNYSLRRHHGLTFEEYSEMLSDQCGVCFICKEPPAYERLAVDHCHKTGVIRGLLCGNCNKGLGHFKDNEDNLLSAIQYLRNVPAKIVVSKQFRSKEIALPPNDGARKELQHP